MRLQTWIWLRVETSTADYGAGKLGNEMRTRQLRKKLA